MPAAAPWSSAAGCGTVSSAITSKDVDIEVYGVPADPLRDLLSVFGRVETVGESFTVYKVGDIDVSLPRRESKTGRGHRGFAVEGDPAMSFAEAARRRDFTINAIAWDPLTGEYVDPFDGRARPRAPPAARRRSADVRRRQPARAARGRSSSRASTSPSTRRRSRSAATIPLDDLPSERIWGEIEKLLLLPARPSIGFASRSSSACVDRLFPELAALVGCPQEPEWHPEGDVWVHTLLVIDEARARIGDLVRAPNASRSCSAPSATTSASRRRPPSSTGASDRSATRRRASRPRPRVLDRLNVHTIDGYDVRAQVLGLIAHHLKPGPGSR